VIKINKIKHTGLISVKSVTPDDGIVDRNIRILSTTHVFNFVILQSAFVINKTVLTAKRRVDLTNEEGYHWVVSQKEYVFKNSIYFGRLCHRQELHGTLCDTLLRYSTCFT
jgi:hypothetical protein